MQTKLIIWMYVMNTMIHRCIHLNMLTSAKFCIINLLKSMIIYLLYYLKTLKTNCLAKLVRILIIYRMILNLILIFFFFIGLES